MKHKFSLIVCCLIGVVLLSYRVSYSDANNHPLKVTTWDALGYYYYLPGTFIYNDITKLDWLSEIDQEYSVTGGKLYQVSLHTNGNYVGKYLGGVAIMQTPFFLLGHAIAKCSHYKADGFSPPYQYAIAFGGLVYGILALFLLRYLLLKYFEDWNVAVALFLMALATNFIQYIALDSAMSHSYIILLYPLVVYTTIEWHESPKIKWAALTAFIIGLATICRPTEAIMIFIPILWNTHHKEGNKAKWEKVMENKSHILYALLFGMIGILPQLMYWKIASGSFIYNVGSKWVFFNPFFRVLFGWETGWFIYTPITILFVLGLFFIKKFPFKNAFIIFCLLNIWIIISWWDWRYGATYSTRALVQSYPIFAFGFTAIITKILNTKIKYPFYILGVYLIFVNLFQIYQYNADILHYRDMNRKFYSHIYLNPSPTPIDMSLLDTDEYLDYPSKYSSEKIIQFSNNALQSRHDSSAVIINQSIPYDTIKEKNKWIKIETKILASKGLENSYLQCELLGNNKTKTTKIRLNNALCKKGAINHYAFYFKIPKYTPVLNVLQISVVTDYQFEGVIKEMDVYTYTN